MQSGEFGTVLRRLYKGLKYASIGMIAVSAIVIGRETANFYTVCYDITPFLGYAFLGAVGAGLWIGVVRPLRRYWLIPAAVKPPTDDSSVTSATIDQVVLRAHFLGKLAENL